MLRMVSLLRQATVTARRLPWPAATCASTCLSTAARPLARSPPLPAWYLSTNAVRRSWSALPPALDGVVAVCGLAKIFRNVANFASLVSVGSVSAELTVGTFRSCWASGTSAAGSSDSHLTSCQAASRLRPVEVLRDAERVAGDVARAVQVGLRVVDRHRRGRVVELRVLAVDERGAVLTVEVHRQLAGLEHVGGRELRVAGARGEPAQLVVADRVDELLLEREHRRPVRVGGEVALAVGRRPGARRTAGRRGPAPSRRSPTAARSRRP